MICCGPYAGGHAATLYHVDFTQGMAAARVGMVQGQTGPSTSDTRDQQGAYRACSAISGHPRILIYDSDEDDGGDAHNVVMRSS